MVLEDSSNAENMRLRIHGTQLENEQKQIIKGMKTMQSNVYSMIKDPSNIWLCLNILLMGQSWIMGIECCIDLL